MAGSVYGTLFQIMTWGESHGKGIGVTVDGCPAGLPLSEAHVQEYLDRRRPGQGQFTTKRRESDQVEILSGVFEGKTTGTPIAMEIRNQDQRSRDYSDIMDVYRPGHADYTFDRKFGFRDYRGGGRSSGRETAGRVAGGAVAARFLEAFGVHVRAYTRSIGPVCVAPERFDLEEMWRNPLYMPDGQAAEEAQAYLREVMAGQDSAGGVIECVITGLPAGVGDPVFDKLDACLAKAILSVGAVKGFEIGEGFRAARLRGSEDNDGFCAGPDGRIRKTANHAGGVLGGISDGAPVVFRAAIKPTPSIAMVQKSVTRRGEERELTIRGRHDPVIVPRAVVVVEAMAALAAADLLLRSAVSRMDRLQEMFGAAKGPGKEQGHEDRIGK